MQYTEEWEKATKAENTNFKPLNEKIGDKFEVVKNNHYIFEIGEIVVLKDIDGSSSPQFKNRNGDIASCTWYKVKPIETWVPEQGEMVIIWETNKTNTMEREFISMTSKDDYLCWDEFKTYAYTWNEAQPVKKELLYERRWKMLLKQGDYTEESIIYYNQEDIDEYWETWSKGKYVDVLVNSGDPIVERRWKMLIDGVYGHTDETVTYYNQERIDSDWGDRYKGSFIDVLVKDK